MLSSGFDKIAFTSKHTLERKVKATPKKHGGKDGRGGYTIKFHPEENRWSCTCPDWQNRRKFTTAEEHDLHDCKHIKGHLAKTKAWLVAMKKYPREFLDRRKQNAEQRV
jgi:hypothetical protein